MKTIVLFTAESPKTIEYKIGETVHDGAVGRAGFLRLRAEHGRKKPYRCVWNYLTTTLSLTAFAMIAFAANSLLCRLALMHTAIDPATFTAVRVYITAVSFESSMGSTLVHFISFF